jgi:nitronate monooxygenase
VQIGSAYLHCPESKIAAPHRTLLRSARGRETAVTNVMTGRPARGFVNRVMRELGPISSLAPAFPLAGGALAPLGAKAQAQGSGDFSSMWAGQAAGLGKELPAGELTIALANEAQALMRHTAS